MINLYKDPYYKSTSQRPPRSTSASTSPWYPAATTQSPTSPTSVGIVIRLVKTPAPTTK